MVFDPEGCHDNDRSDRFDTFTEARDAALSCVELMLDEEDYDGEDHRLELEQMLGILENASSYADLEECPRTSSSCPGWSRLIEVLPERNGHRGRARRYSRSCDPRNWTQPAAGIA